MTRVLWLVMVASTLSEFGCPAPKKTASRPVAWDLGASRDPATFGCNKLVGTDCFGQVDKEIDIRVNGGAPARLTIRECSGEVVEGKLENIMLWSGDYSSSDADTIAKQLIARLASTEDAKTAATAQLSTWEADVGGPSKPSSYKLGILVRRDPRITVELQEAGYATNEWHFIITVSWY